MSQVTPGQAAYEKWRTDSPYALVPWEQMPSQARKRWENVAIAARNWAPAPKKLGKVADLSVRK